jgi:EmrB/QacA subfamily drug resistance transporter
MKGKATGVTDTRRPASKPALGPVPYIVAGCMFMENLDATVIATALPTMARAFSTDIASLSLGISAYMVAVAVFLPLSTWLSDRFGARGVMAVSIAVFVATSMACGAATSLETFVAMRVAQGASAALMSPAGRLTVLRGTPKAHLVHAMAILVWPSLIAPVLGPPLGGLITTFASWRWIFFLNLPIGLIGLALVLRFVPNERSDARPPFDWTGFMLGGAALGCLIVGLEMVGTVSGRSATGAPLMVGGLVLGALTLRHLTRTPHPLVNLAPVRVPSFAISALTGGTLTRIAVSATPFLIPILFQTVFGYSALRAGAMTLVYFAGNLGMKLVTTALLRRFGFRRILLVNGACVTLTVAALAWVSLQPPLFAVALILLLGGATRSLQFTALNTLAFAEIDKAHSGDANTLNSLLQQIAFTLGVALAAFGLQASKAVRGADVLSVTDFQAAFIGVSLCGALALVFYAKLSAGTGREVSGHRA